ncbi:lanthionine synthetase C family protein [Actinomadura madurae]|uniref:lanthionine synthetase C family protein n=1 Tax=Actinomadura madurae TaxID=1993 RepID=UPI0020265C20|nr:lanthionine synthetase C family protein [Actinomadura madurae]URM97386.1 lanthionine synthetase C family protein [Actinomadura madurae]
MSSPPIALTFDQAHHQSLATGTAGIAILHIERALTGRGCWADAHTHIRQVAAGPVDGGDHTGLFYGAPALAFLLSLADADGQQRYAEPLGALDHHVTLLTHRRVVAALRRIETGEHARFAEYDLFHGLTGIGALLLARRPGSDTFAEILGYLARLTRPRRQEEDELPGWWVLHDPDPTLPTPGGHANFGMAHGAAGILALLALAARGGHLVDQQYDAIHWLMNWFDRWRQESPDGLWWPQWITRSDLRVGRLTQRAPGRPSWCYGSIGIARALQLAALAVGDLARQRAAERALLTSLTDRSLTRLTEPGVCHGLAGLYQTAYHAAHDSTDPALLHRLPALAAALISNNTHGEAPGLLTGRAGTDLVLETARSGASPQTGWDRCLLIC